MSKLSKVQLEELEGRAFYPNAPFAIYDRRHLRTWKALERQGLVEVSPVKPSEWHQQIATGKLTAEGREAVRLLKAKSQLALALYYLGEAKRIMEKVDLVKRR